MIDIPGATCTLDKWQRIQNLHYAITVSEAAQEWGLPRSSIRYPINAGHIPARVSKAARIASRVDLEAYFFYKPVDERLRPDLSIILTNKEVARIYSISIVAVTQALYRETVIARQSASRWLVDARSAYEMWGWRLDGLASDGA